MIRHALPWRARVLWDPSNLFGGRKPTPAPPTVTPPPPMPDPMAPDVLAARRKTLADTMRGGRLQTELTTPLAAGMGAGTKLGA